MTKDNALNYALQLAKKRNVEMYVVIDFRPGAPTDSYEVCVENSLHNFYACCPIKAIAYPCGSID